MLHRDKPSDTFNVIVLIETTLPFFFVFDNEIEAVQDYIDYVEMIENNVELQPIAKPIIVPFT